MTVRRPDGEEARDLATTFPDRGPDSRSGPASFEGECRAGSSSASPLRARSHPAAKESQCCSDGPSSAPDPEDGQGGAGDDEEAGRRGAEQCSAFTHEMGFARESRRTGSCSWREARSSSRRRRKPSSIIQHRAARAFLDESFIRSWPRLNRLEPRIHLRQVQVAAGSCTISICAHFLQGETHNYAKQRCKHCPSKKYKQVGHSGPRKWQRHWLVQLDDWHHHRRRSRGRTNSATCARGRNTFA